MIKENNNKIKSKNNTSFIHFLLDRKAIVMTIIVILAFSLRLSISIMQNNTIMIQSLSDSLEFASIISVSIIAILIYFKESIHKLATKRITTKEHTVIFGLGDFGIALLENELNGKERDCIIFEKNIHNEKIEYFRKAGMGVIEGDALDYHTLEKLNFDTMKHAVISIGSDRLNMELATMIIDLYKEKKIKSPIKLVVQIINKDLNALFHQSSIAPQMDNKHKIDVKTFSFYEEVAEKFFEQNFIDGEDDSITKGSDDYHIAVVGNGELALNIIYQAGKIAHLPNENLLHIHLIDKDAEKFKRKVLKRYSGVNSILKLHVHNIDDETLEYYAKDKGSIWNIENLTHVIICYDDEEHNLNIATDLFNKTYLSDVVDDTMVTQVSFALFNAYQMGSKIDADKSSFKQFHSFGDVKSICTREGLMDEKDDLLAKLIHKGYAEEFDPNFLYDLQDKKTLEEIHEKWYDNSRLSDKLSSKTQSKHISMKLKALGLRYEVSKKIPSELLKLNRMQLDNVLQEDRNKLKISDDFLKEYSKELPKLWDEVLKDKQPIDVKYFPREYNTMFEKLIRAEHNRWNAFHYLNGWTFNEVKSKPKKQHDCLKPLADFEKPELQLTVLYDMYSILYIPNYLANAGFEIMKIQGGNQ